MIVSQFLPEAVVVQCGGDSLHSDPVGKFNLSIDAVGRCVRMIKGANSEFKKPLNAL